MEFVEVDGYIKNTSASSGGGLGGLLGGMMGGIMSAASGDEEWVECKRWVRQSRVDEVDYEEYPVKLAKKAVPRLQQLGVPAEDVEEPESKYAPEGWWIRVGFPNGTLYHVVDPDRGKGITESSSDDQVASALLRLAEEIALKPSSVPGGEVLKAQSRFEKISNE